MSESSIKFKYEIDKGEFIVAHSVDPELKIDDLERLLVKNDGGEELDLAKMRKRTRMVSYLDSFEDLRVEVSDEKFKVPERLVGEREKLGLNLASMGKTNGDIALVRGEVGIPLKLMGGKYFDYMAAKDVEEKRPRYLGFTYLLHTENGKKFNLVQRSNNVEVAKGLMSTVGSTPQPNLNGEIDIYDYFKSHIVEEIEEELSMGRDEFSFSPYVLADDREFLPLCYIEIETDLSTGEIARRIFGKKEALEEHTALYEFPFLSLGKVLDRFCVFESNAYVMHELYC
jgi:hypothetical protein